MKSSGRWLAGGISILFLVTAFGFSYAQAPIKWKGQTAYAPTPDVGPFKGSVAGTGNGGVYLRNWIERRTQGRLTFECAPPGAIVPIDDMFNALKRGVFDFIFPYYPASHGGIMPETDVEIGLPMAWERPEEAWDCMINRGLHEEFVKIYAEHNILPFGLAVSNTTYGIGCTFRCPNLNALKGKKIRAVGIYGDLVRKLGASPVALPAGEMYMALKLGTIDGCLFGLENAEIYKLKEVWKDYVMSPNFNVISDHYYANLNSFNKLPADIKTLFVEDAKFVMQITTQNNYMYDRYIAAKAMKEYPSFKIVHWPAEDLVQVRKVAFSLWDSVAAKSPRCAKLVDIVKTQMREIGKME